MFFSGLSCQCLFPHCESQPTSTSSTGGGTGLWTCCGTTQSLIWPYSCMFLPPVSTAARARAFSFVGTLIVTESTELIVWISSAACIAGRKVLDSFFSHSIPVAQLWFYPYHCMWVIHKNLLLRVHWRIWFCASVDWVCKWCSSLDYRDPGDARYAGKSGHYRHRRYDTIRVFLAYGIFAPVGIKHGDGTATWIAGTLVVPGVQGKWWLWAEEIQHFRIFFLVSGCFASSKDQTWRLYSCLEHGDLHDAMCLGMPAAKVKEI